MLSEQEYQKLKERDMQIALEREKFIKECDDPTMSNRDSRPIMDIKHMFESSVALFGDRAAFMQKPNRNAKYESITYRQALEDVNGLGTALIAGGLKGKRIAVIGENSYQWAISYLAIVCGTGIVVPIDKELSKAEIANILKKADVACIFADKKREPILKEILEEGETALSSVISMTADTSEGKILSQKELIENGKAMVAKGDTSFIKAQIIRDEMSILLFTSGTTGKSKGVMLSHGNIAEDLMAAPTYSSLGPGDIFFSFLPLHHTYECTCGFLMPLYKGCTIAYCEGLKYMLKNLSECQPTFFLGVPAIFENVYKKIWQNARKKGKEGALRKALAINKTLKKFGIHAEKLLFKDIHKLFGGRMRVIICGGAAINPEVLDTLQEFGFMALQGYGLTEASPMGALNPEKATNSSSIGKPLTGFDAKIVNKNEEGIGEICLKGPNIMMGYYEMPEETAAVIDSEGWFHTGDLGYMDEERYIYITGRQKNVIITKNGKNVYPEELEYLIGLTGISAESMVWEAPSEAGDDTLIVATVVPDMTEMEERLGENPTATDMTALIWAEIEKINESLPFYKKIKKLVFRSEPLVKNTSNKVIRFSDDNKKLQ